MLIELKNKILDLYHKVIGSIAFYPAVIATGLVLLALAVLIVEEYGATVFLEKHTRVLVIYDEDTARTILSVLIGGIISLTVFSFSMVMILLNQASSYFSPRLLPGLISNKSHQFVLGTYLGTIVYCLFVLINIYKPNNDVNLPGLAILLAIVLGIFCLGLFVYFIHNISISIQASSLLFKLFQDTRRGLEKIGEDKRRRLPKGEKPELPDLPHPIYCQRTGYLHSISEINLMALAEEHDFVIRMNVTQGMFVLRNSPVATLDREVGEEVQEDICSCFTFSNQEIVADNYILGFKQMTEVAVKAMSPGINDPGTAITAMDFLTELLAIRIHISDHEWMENGAGKRRIFYRPVRFKTLLYLVFAALRQYVKHDAIVVQKLLRMLDYLLAQKNLDEGHEELLRAEKEAVMADARRAISNWHDRKVLEGLFDKTD